MTINTHWWWSTLIDDNWHSLMTISTCWWQLITVTNKSIIIKCHLLRLYSITCSFICFGIWNTLMSIMYLVWSYHSKKVQNTKCLVKCYHLKCLIFVGLSFLEISWYYIFTKFLLTCIEISENGNNFYFHHHFNVML